MTPLPDIQQLLRLDKAPVAIGIFDTPPPGVSPWTGGEVPSGCTFWRMAQDGAVFYTIAADHYNCAVGAYTHAISLPPERAGELMQTLQFMGDNRYVSMDEVPGIPTLKATPTVVAYGPAEKVPFQPHVIIVAAKPAQAMLLYEAALKAGVSGALMNTLGRPGCAAIPLALNTGAAAMSLGCKGNRTYTGLPEDELYLSIPGDKWEAVATQLATVLSANAAIAAYHTERKMQFETE